jgi:hypothetical protein
MKKLLNYKIGSIRLVTALLIILIFVLYFVFAT